MVSADARAVPACRITAPISHGTGPNSERRRTGRDGPRRDGLGPGQPARRRSWRSGVRRGSPGSAGPGCGVPRHGRPMSRSQDDERNRESIRNPIFAVVGRSGSPRRHSPRPDTSIPLVAAPTLGVVQSALQLVDVATHELDLAVQIEEEVSPARPRSTRSPASGTGTDGASPRAPSPMTPRAPAGRGGDRGLIGLGPRGTAERRPTRRRPCEQE